MKPSTKKPGKLSNLPRSNRDVDERAAIARDVDKRRQAELDEFREWLAIDKNDLDNELVQRAQLFDKVQEAYARAVSVRDDAKTSMDEAYSKVCDEIRRTGAPKGERVTDSAVKEQAAIHPTYLQAQILFFDAKKHADLLAAKVESFRDRSRAMKELVDLYASQYWMRAGETGQSRKVAQQQAEQEMVVRGRK